MRDAFRINFYRSGTETGIENGKTGIPGIAQKEAAIKVEKLAEINRVCTAFASGMDIVFLV